MKTKVSEMLKKERDNLITTLDSIYQAQQDREKKRKKKQRIIKRVQALFSVTLIVVVAFIHWR